ncbi:hypothetical protein M3231_11855 [Neobacillus mesonae]|nr:hypothetical protein [Neobacillus mesonae]
MTLELLMTAALGRGLLLSDFDDMTIGMIYDFIYQYDNLRQGGDKEEVRNATQDDINDFFGSRRG